MGGYGGTRTTPESTYRRVHPRREGDRCDERRPAGGKDDTGRRKSERENQRTRRTEGREARRPTLPYGGIWVGSAVRLREERKDRLRLHPNQARTRTGREDEGPRTVVHPCVSAYEVVAGVINFRNVRCVTGPPGSVWHTAVLHPGPVGAPPPPPSTVSTTRGPTERPRRPVPRTRGKPDSHTRRLLTPVGPRVAPWCLLGVSPSRGGRRDVGAFSFGRGLPLSLSSPEDVRPATPDSAQRLGGRGRVAGGPVNPCGA